MARDDELLQRIAAAAIPRRTGAFLSRYGQPAYDRYGGPAPVLGKEAPTLRLGEDGTAPRLGRARPVMERPGSSQQDQEDEYNDRAYRQLAEQHGEEPPEPQGAETSPEENQGVIDALGALRERGLISPRDYELYAGMMKDDPRMGREDLVNSVTDEFLKTHDITREDLMRQLGGEP